ncbi:MAG TPA: hypothetical protein VHW65_09990 [Gemmatimonadales bacterium]|jgi:hypothetical protein|nr:hypothetical protein [Gemmatimonadales bacterium]
MIRRPTMQRVRSIVALALFALSGGGAQLADALVFHRGPPRADVERMNAGDHCHGESCDLGAPIVSPPPAFVPYHDGRFAPPTRALAAVAPADAPRPAIRARSLGSRAPPISI